MKKLLWLVFILLIGFIGLIYFSVSSTDKEFETVTIQEVDDLESIDFRRHDSVEVAASSLYKANELKDIMQGDNYREAWTSPVKVPVLFLDSLYGGVEIVKEGGGTQTHSLRLKDKNGFLYSLRSVNKDPSTHVPEFARSLGLQNIVIDAISASHPYGAILAASLSEKAGVLHTHPNVVFVPKQEFLEKQYNEKYGNRLFLLEYETEGEENWTDYKNVYKILDTKNLQELKEENPAQVSIDKNAFVRARLFDMLIGDWDRHAKQWGWVVQKEGENFKAIPLAGDRDNAFFNLGGVIPGIIANKNIEPEVRPFEKEIKHMPGLVYPNDVYFLTNTPVEIFTAEAKKLQDLLTDDTIADAFKVWPKNIAEQNSKEITEKIKSRRDNLVEYAKEFHRIINERELLNTPLKGSEDIKISPELMKCFECGD
ncbi:hypothetical protein [Salegentibacter mishustinae]|uniref:Uncharacterized protein n=1 Tax=Salegentibacter mishustinae TaxID=270918 RepID=A0A0Q9ZKH7_9FLAO|nr:hypothetical protein [Salegentibacter mishustinae]KRG28931.1 hypothetical protein APR42_03095 [Salegentibacter mishustinae]PNW22019.1 hypothetical protein APB85_12400 [Salegentibacter mishustinae]PZX65378.1 hypothetical protein LY54_01672 [Salegentibacter mishustinae]GGW85446.1 hypothetical protein GCM10008086_12050 [Salegentibacter mishustinae]